MTSLAKRFRTRLEILSQRIPWRLMLIIFAGALLLVWLQYTPDGLLGKADAVGYAVCHRIDARSFHLGDRQVPVCARCTGQYLGAMLGLLYLFIARPRRTGRPPWILIGILVVWAAFYALDGLNSYIHLFPELSRFYLYDPSNPLRLMTGTGLGLGVSVMLYPAFNQTLWKRVDRRPVLEGFRDLGLLLALGACIDWLVLTENPLILYPLVLVSAGGILVLLTIVYAMAVVMVFGIENRFERTSQLVYPLMAGFVVALLQIAALDYIRYLLTGSWDGFHFG